MKKNWSVAIMEFHNNTLNVYHVEGTNWKSALIKAYGQDMQTRDHKMDPRTEAYLWELPADMTEAKEEAFNSDWLFDVKEIEGTIVGRSHTIETLFDLPEQI
jgi:hypothetical protein